MRFPIHPVAVKALAAESTLHNPSTIPHNPSTLNLRLPHKFAPLPVNQSQRGSFTLFYALAPTALRDWAWCCSRYQSTVRRSPSRMSILGSYPKASRAAEISA